MKKLLLSTLLVAAMMPMSMSAQGQSWTPSEPAEGTFYLYNVGAKSFIVGANNWGTRASVVGVGGIPVKLSGSGSYKISTDPTYSGKILGDNGYVDNGGNGTWTFEAVSGANNVYKMKANNNQYLFADEGATTTSMNANAPSTDFANWQLISKEDFIAALPNASENSPMDATPLILNPNFGRESNKRMWTGADFGLGGANENFNAEKWGGNSQTFDISQTVEVPNGLYQITWNGFYRYNNTSTNTNTVAISAHADGSEVINSFVYFNSDEYALMSIADESASTALNGNLPFSQAAAGEAFGRGLYEQTALVVVTDGKLTIGIKKINHPGCDWTVWDNFRLSYYGANADVETVKQSILAESLQELIDKAKTLLPTAEGSIGNQLSNAISQGEQASTSSEMESAIANLKDVISLSSYYVTIKDRLAKMKELIDATNVYTEEAYNTYYAEPYNKYYNSVLTKNEVIELMNSLQDPLAVAGWHDVNLKVDNFLLSAWDADPDYPDNNPYYINTWSTEGVEGSSNYMGAEFGVPFFEYWVSDGKRLSERSLTATLEKYLDGDQFVELKDGEYKVRAWVRVLMNAGADHPYGITLTVNDGEPVDVCAGAQVGSSLFYMDTFEAIGKVEGGKLTIKFNIAADNNVSWLSFKDVMIEAPAPDVAITSLSVTPQPVLINDETKSFDVNLTVQNLGNEAAQNVVIKLSDGKGWSVTYPSTSDATSGAAGSEALTLEAGEELAITFTYDQELTPGSVSLRAEISADGEKNIDNNSSSTSVRLVMDGSDMTITNVEAPKSLLIEEGKESASGTIKVTVKNLGTQAAEGVSVVLNVNGEKYAASAPITVEAGKEEVVEIEFSSSKSGDYTLTAEVISDADVDEENNLWADEIVIKVKNQGELTAGLDLSIENIDVPEMSDGAIRVNDEEGGYTVNVSVYNNGTEDAENVVVKLFINGEEFATNADVEGFETLNLASAEMVEIPFFVENPEFTDVEIYAEVIAEGDVDESNNVSETITAGVKYEGIDVALLDVIYPDAISVDSEDDAIVTVMVKNISEDSRVTDDKLLKAENIVVHLYIDGVEVATSKPFSLYKGADAHAYLAIDRNYLTSEEVILTARVTADKDGNESNDWSEELPIQVSGVVTGIDSILARFGQNAQVYTLDGKKVDLSSGMLKKGLYIINGKKTAIK